jgi:UDP-2,3-diacylglucosamine hydrolase
MTSEESPVYFVSDAHLGRHIAGCDDREKHLLAFLDTAVSNASHLFIVGDLFDFWIEYRYSIRPDYFEVLHVLRKLVSNGVEVHYLAGNHDFALGAFLEETVGLHIHLDHFETVLQGKKVHLFHGDGLIEADVGYRALRKVLRNPVNQRLYKLIHPDIGVPLGSFFSGSSRKLTSRWLNERILEEYRDRAREYLAEGNDIVIFAHTHIPEIRQWEGKTFCNPGEWIEKYTFAKLANGVMSLWKYLPGQLPQQIPDSSSTRKWTHETQ